MQIDICVFYKKNMKHKYHIQRCFIGLATSGIGPWLKSMVMTLKSH